MLVALYRPRRPRASALWQWRELIQKVLEVDPFICPNCARLMHINGLLEDRNSASGQFRRYEYRRQQTLN